MEKSSRRSQLTRKELLQVIDQLPVDLSDAYHSPEIFDVTKNIARRYKFNEDESWELYGLIYDVILGFLPPDDISSELAERLALPKDRAGFIEGEINAFIFNHIREELDRLYGGQKDQKKSKKEEKEEKEAPPKTYQDQGQDDPYREPLE